MTDATDTDATDTEDRTPGPSAVPQSSVQESYKHHHAEIQRRQDVLHSQTHNPPSFQRAANAAETPFRYDTQTHFVWSASHERMAPLAKDALHPALRIYGIFPSYEEALEHTKIVASLDPTCSLMISPTHEWTMLPRSPERLADAVEHIPRVLAAYKEARDKSTSEFHNNVETRRGGVGRVPGKRVGSDVEDTGAADLTDASDGLSAAENTAAPRRLGRDAEVRDQNVVAVTFLRDTTQNVGEPIFRVYAAFDNTTSGDVWARCAGDTVVEYDIDLVSTCVWLFVNDIEAEHIPQEVYRSKELDAIIANQKKQPQLCENFKKWRDESESEA